ncbi:hypothetical protein M404DRAFT_30050 [Pisolithus tinctorius Marx 270]|uniref:Uncharacterized protein n=1 Tax=Pisolithus tinctorius Marx 270 TaxID=870435 RepID=A0A0C3NWS1_PISTI|nr:hypothetical protein M404DRAFT_30050 [Pisolithus tinctorius Marx 270]
MFRRERHIAFTPKCIPPLPPKLAVSIVSWRPSPSGSVLIAAFLLADAEGNEDSTSEPSTFLTGATIASVSFACTLYILVCVISERTRLSTSSTPIFTSPRVPLSPSCRVRFIVALTTTFLSSFTGVLGQWSGHT